MEIKNLVRQNIRELIAYSSARSEFKGKADIFLDANENPFQQSYNRYPDPQQSELKQLLSRYKGCNIDNIFIGNGSDEAIDLLLRAFCTPRKNLCYQFDPTYGMYQVSAAINDITLKRLTLTSDFQLPSWKSIEDVVRIPGLMFICSPNNPTGSSFSVDTIEEYADNFEGIVVIDEAYIDFSSQESCLQLIQSHSNIVVLQTLSKAYGLAGIRVGMAFANSEIISILNKIKPPYNVSSSSIDLAIKRLNNKTIVNEEIQLIIKEREHLKMALEALPFVEKVYPSGANFLLIKVEEPLRIYNYLKDAGIIIRDQSNKVKGGLRISIGTPSENAQLIKTLKSVQ